VDANAGTVAETIDYDAWGNATVDDTTCATGAVCAAFQPFGFAGGLFDRETGLVRFGARDYDPNVGRWTQKDPITFDGGQSNIYEYAGDDPINGSDPRGTGPFALFYCMTQCKLGDFTCLAICLATTPTFSVWPSPSGTGPVQAICGPSQPREICQIIYEDPVNNECIYQCSSGLVATPRPASPGGQGPANDVCPDAIVRN
jgi:RHS repeat-associated protein